MPVTATRQIAAAASATGEEAVTAAVVEAVAGVDDPGGVLFFPTCETADAAAKAETAAAGCRTAGMTGSATLTDAGPRMAGCAAMAFDRSLPVGIATREGASADLAAAAGEATAAALAELPAEALHRVVLLFADTTSGDQAAVVAGAYRVAGPLVPLAGGGAGGPQPAQFADGRTLHDSVVAVAIGSVRPIGLGVADGCRMTGTPSIVTRADGRMLLELDGRPAEHVYLEKLGHTGRFETEQAFERFAALHPLAQPELSGDCRLRHVLGRTELGGLYCATSVTSHAAVEFTNEEPELVVRSSWDAVSAAVEQLRGAEPAAALVFDCAGRKRVLEDRLEREVEVIRSSFGAAPAIAGVYTHGEIGRARGAKGDRNHALVVVAFA